MKFLRLQLKVCEGCGGLWFRAVEDGKVYCERCSGVMAMHAMAQPERRRGRRAGRRNSLRTGDVQRSATGRFTGIKAGGAR